MKLDTDNIFAALLSTTPAAQAWALQKVRRYAEQRLRAACERMGIAVDDLADNDRAVVAYLLLDKSDAERSEKKAALLMRLCIAVEEQPAARDPLVPKLVLALRDMEHAKASQQQRDRALQGGTLTEEQQRRMRDQYAHRVRDGQKYGAVKALARAFGVSERTVHDVVKLKRIRKRPG